MSELNQKIETQSVRFLKLENKIDKNSEEIENNFLVWVNILKEQCLANKEETVALIDSKIEQLTLTIRDKLDTHENRITIVEDKSEKNRQKIIHLKETMDKTVPIQEHPSVDREEMI